jgi:hypothetical protein
MAYQLSEWSILSILSREVRKSSLHNGNKYASVPIIHLVHLKETSENLKLLLEGVTYKEYRWILGEDLKVKVCCSVNHLPNFYA